jgi:bis(5'-nucleosyl)-tetraphosphatase (symmetrical)
MATYVVGDVQGCFDPLQRLLEQVRFDSAQDRLWLCGDLVNRGPQSLQVLRYVRRLGAAAVTVLGNHDLHLLARAHGARSRRFDTLDAVLAAPDRDELLDWLRRRPLLHTTPAGDTAMLHAGLPPQWDLPTAQRCAAEVEAVLRGDGWLELLHDMYGDQPDTWNERLGGFERLRFILNCFTRLRYCSAGGKLEMQSKGAPGSQPAGLYPWFAVPGRRSAQTTLLFGHWSTLERVHWPEHRVYCLDTGAVWGELLSALRLEDGALFQVASAAYSPIE